MDSSIRPAQDQRGSQSATPGDQGPSQSAVVHQAGHPCKQRVDRQKRKRARLGITQASPKVGDDLLSRSAVSSAAWSSLLCSGWEQVFPQAYGHRQTTKDTFVSTRGERYRRNRLQAVVPAAPRPESTGKSRIARHKCRTMSLEYHAALLRRCQTVRCTDHQRRGGW